MRQRKDYRCLIGFGGGLGLGARSKYQKTGIVVLVCLNTIGEYRQTVGQGGFDRGYDGQASVVRALLAQGSCGPGGIKSLGHSPLRMSLEKAIALHDGHRVRAHLLDVFEPVAGESQ